MDINMNIDMDVPFLPTFQIFGCRRLDICHKFHPIFDIMSDSAIFSPISETLISGSVRDCLSRISVCSFGQRTFDLEVGDKDSRQMSAIGDAKEC
jgi:hypothetical protein